MNDNPYAPPAAPVNDVDPPVTLDRPPSVILAVRLLWSEFGLSGVVTIYGIFSLPDNAPRVALYGTAIILLFMPTANAWYREMKRWR